MSKIPLGRDTENPDEYSPELLFPVPRAEGRAAIGIGDDLPFRGEDIWNAWELTWLDSSGKPRVAGAEIRVDAASPDIIESKSMKLYLNSLAMTEFDTVADVERTITTDLSRVAGTDVDLKIRHAGVKSSGVQSPPGTCVDEAEFAGTRTAVDASLLQSDGSDVVGETLNSNLLRSLCPVTGQPDIGSVMVKYRGPRIDRSALLTYIVSYRQHSAFHESCVERMFVDIKERCRADRLSVYARFNRRGGIDINPFRSDFEDSADNIRLWRQ